MPEGQTCREGPLQPLWEELRRAQGGEGKEGGSGCMALGSGQPGEAAERYPGDHGGVWLCVELDTNLCLVGVRNEMTVPGDLGFAAAPCGFPGQGIAPPLPLVRSEQPLKRMWREPRLSDVGSVRRCCKPVSGGVVEGVQRSRSCSPRYLSYSCNQGQYQNTTLAVIRAAKEGHHCHNNCRRLTPVP